MAQAIKGSPMRFPGSFRAFQKSVFDPFTDSECEDGRGPKRKQVRLENTDGSMPGTSNQDSESQNDLQVKYDLAKI